MIRKRALQALALMAGAAVFCGAATYAHEPEQGDPPGNLKKLTKEIKKGNLSIALEPVADGLIAPNWGVAAPGVPGRLFVTDQNGVLWSIDLNDGSKSVFLDVTDRIVSLGIFGPGSFDERGLLGVAFHPEYAANGLFYTYTSEPNSGAADFSTMGPTETADHQTVILEWRITNPAALVPTYDAGSPREILRIDQPQFNHDGGAIAFGPDGMLYIALGDGGAANDVAPGHGEIGNGQDTSNPLGAILRIDVNGQDSANSQYGVPGDNPFVNTPGFVHEIYAYGFRNPYRMSFDSVAGDLYTGDVGQNDIEEVDIVLPGGNYGWRLKEGSFFFVPDGDRDGNGIAVKRDPHLGDTAGMIDPVAEFETHEDGHSVIGGFVYRGSRFPELVGRYIFGEFADVIFFGDGLFTNSRLFFLNKTNLVTGDKLKKSKIVEFNYPGDQLALPYALLGFGQDADGELYFLANTTGVPFGGGPDLDVPTGVVLRLVRADE